MQKMIRVPTTSGRWVKTGWAPAQGNYDDDDDGDDDGGDGDGDGGDGDDDGDGGDDEL